MSLTAIAIEFFLLNIPASAPGGLSNDTYGCLASQSLNICI